MNFLKVLSGLFTFVIVSVILWTVLYLAVPAIEDKTDKLFKWNDYAVEETVDSTVETTANISSIVIPFENVA